MRNNNQRTKTYKYNLRSDRNKLFDTNRNQTYEKTPRQPKLRSYKSKRDSSVFPLTSEPLYTMPNSENNNPGIRGSVTQTTSEEFHGFTDNINDFNTEGSQPTGAAAAIANAQLDEFINANANPRRSNSNRPIYNTMTKAGGSDYTFPSTVERREVRDTGAIPKKTGQNSQVNRNLDRLYPDAREDRYTEEEEDERLARLVKRMVNLALKEELDKTKRHDVNSKNNPNGNENSKSRNYYSQDRRRSVNNQVDRQDFPGGEARNSVRHTYENDRNRRDHNLPNRANNHSNEPVYNEEFNNSYSNYPKLGEWGFKFDGFNYTVSDFIFRVEDSRETYDCSWDYVVQKFHFLLAGKAEKWFWGYKKNHRVVSWNQLKLALQKNFGLEEDEDVLQKMFDLKQQPNESFSSYFEAMSELNNRLSRPMNEHDIKLIKRIASNVSDPLRRLTFNHNCTSIYDLYKLCINAEKLVKDLRVRNRYVGKVNEIKEETDSEEQLEVHAYNSNNINQRFKSKGNQKDDFAKKNSFISACYCCQDPSHGFYQCPYKGSFIYCFKCHMPGVITPNCPRCKNVNQAENERKSGERPGQPQTEPKEDLDQDE